MSIYDNHDINYVRQLLYYYFMTSKRPTECQYHELIDAIMDKNTFEGDINLHCHSIQNLSALTYPDPNCNHPLFIHNDVVMRNLTADNVNILHYEISGFEITGDLNLQQNITVSGVGLFLDDVYVSGLIITPCGDSLDWCSVFNTVLDTSANWNSVYTTVNETSSNWESNFTTVQENSANWESVYIGVNGLSSNWNSVYASVAGASANWGSVYTSVVGASGNWDSAYTTVNGASARWGAAYTTLTANSGNWSSAYTTVCSNSSLWFHGGLYVPLSGFSTISGPITISNNTLTPESICVAFLSGFCEEVVGTMHWLSAGCYSMRIWGDEYNYLRYDYNQSYWVFDAYDDGPLYYSETGSDVSPVGYEYFAFNPIDGKIAVFNGACSSIWDVTFRDGGASAVTFVSNEGNSDQWCSGYTTLNANSGNWGSAYTTVNGASANWSSSYTTLNANSGNWGSVYTTVNGASANWGSAYTAVNANSANWNQAYAWGNHVTASSNVYSIQPSGSPLTAVVDPANGPIQGLFVTADMTIHALPSPLSSQYHLVTLLVDMPVEYEVSWSDGALYALSFPSGMTTQSIISVSGTNAFMFEYRWGERLPIAHIVDNPEDW